MLDHASASPAVGPASKTNRSVVPGDFPPPEVPGNCGDDDGIGDTPRQEDATFSTCPSGIVPNCTNDPHPGGGMYMNFMDYSGDRWTNMFTIQQVARMRA